MAFTTESNYTGDGSEKDFLITFPFLADADIKVRTKPSGGDWTTHTVTDDYTINNNIVTFGTAPVDSASVQLFRDTNIDKTNSTFQTGASIRAQDLNNLAKQFLYAAQEFEQASTTPSGTGVALTTGSKNKIVVNSANDWTFADGAIPTQALASNSIDSQHYVDGSVDREHLEADIIDGTKLADNAVDSEHYTDGSIDSAHIGDAQVIRTKLPADLQYGFTVIGTVIWYAGTTAPTGYLKCNGDSVPNGNGTIQSITTNYAALYAVVGANLPDLRGEFIRGWDDGKGTDSGRNIRTTQAEEYKQHTHSPTVSTTSGLSGGASSISESWHVDGTASGFITKTTGISSSSTPQHTDGSASDGFTIDANHSHTVTIANSGGAETRPRNVSLLACIKY